MLYNGKSMKKIKTNTYYSMSDLVRKIIKDEKENGQLKINETQFTDKTKNLVKKIHHVILPSLELSELITEYEENKKTPYIIEWKPFFYSLLKYYFLDGTTRETNSIRTQIIKKEHNVDNSLYNYKWEIYTRLIYAIAKGKTPETFLPKLFQTKLYYQARVHEYEDCIKRNIDNLFYRIKEINNFSATSSLLKDIIIIFDSIIKISFDGIDEVPINLEISFPKSLIKEPDLLLEEVNKLNISQRVSIQILQYKIQESLIKLFLKINREETLSSKTLNSLIEINSKLITAIKNSGIGSVITEFQITTPQEIISYTKEEWESFFKNGYIIRERHLQING